MMWHMKESRIYPNLKLNRWNMAVIKKAKVGRPKGDQSKKVYEQMIRILLRNKNESLMDACKAVGITPTTFYYRLKHANFSSPNRGRDRKIALTSVEAKRLGVMVRRIGRLAAAFEAIVNPGK